MEAHDRYAHHRPDDPCGAFVVGPGRLVEGRPGGPLSGTGFGVKDLFDVEGTRTGAGNPVFLEGAPVAASSAAAVRALVEAGSTLVGKTVTDELAFSLSGTNVHDGTPRNPAAPGRVPGGSSAGSAAAVAGGLVELALGSDTAGSVRVPASYCGVASLRPTHGRIDDAGLVPLAPSFDTPGLFARDGVTLEAGVSALLVASSEAAGGPSTARRAPLRRLVVAGDLLALADEAVREPLVRAARHLAEAVGASLVTRPLTRPGRLEAFRDGFRAIQLAEVWATHGAWIDAHDPRFGPGIAARFEAARKADPEAAEAARPLRGEVRDALGDLLGDDGLLVQPAATGPAPVPNLAAGVKDDLRSRLFSLTAPVGMAGAPALTLPLATDPAGLPVGLVVVGLPGDDERLARIGAEVLPGA